jgi:hypothetical protein
MHSRLSCEEMANSIHRKIFLGALLIGGGLVLVLGLKAVLKPKPETYTELYFNQPQRLPSVWPNRPVDFAFHVHNMEGTATNYQYEVLEATASGQPLVVKSGQLTLAKGGAMDVPVTLGVPTQKSRTEVTVILSSQQQIHFWIGANS